LIGWFTKKNAAKLSFIELGISSLEGFSSRILLEITNDISTKNIKSSDILEKLL